MIHKVLWTFVLLSFSIYSRAQFCTGSLGNNIFSEGNFGAGTSNLLSPDPNIAPGYTYTFNVPPLDGEYVVTNNTSSWPGLFPSWLRIPDNSNNPTGYMMVVNASFSPGLFYGQTVSGLCENTLYEFTADIINLIRSGTPDHINPNVSFLLNGVEQFSTGNIPKTNQWATYGFTFMTQPGQQSLTLSLRNNAPGGIGNDLALDNISFRACGPETTLIPEVNPIYLCEDSTTPVEMEAIIIGEQHMNPALQWQQSFDGGLTWQDIPGAIDNTYIHTATTPGSYYYRFIVADGTNNLGSSKCHVNSNTKTIHILPKEVMQTNTICEGEVITVGNSTYTETGVYTDTLSNILGCDSIVITDLLAIASPLVPEITVSPPCSGLLNGSISIDDVTGGVPPYSYTFDGVELGNLNFFSDLMGDQTYSVIIEDNVNCPLILSIYIENQPDINLELGEDQQVELGETIIFSPTYDFMPSSLNWQSTTPIDCFNIVDCEKFDFLPTVSQQIILTLFDENGCPVSDSIFIEVKQVRTVAIPNIFSPNGDNVNDFFTVFAEPLNIKYVEELKVFDRWGNLVFDNNNFPPNILENGWNGKFNGKSVPTGIYAYSATIRFLDDEIIRYTGDVLVVR